MNASQLAAELIEFRVVDFVTIKGRSVHAVLLNEPGTQAVMRIECPAIGFSVRGVRVGEALKLLDEAESRVDAHVLQMNEARSIAREFSLLPGVTAPVPTFVTRGRRNATAPKAAA